MASNFTRELADEAATVKAGENFVAKLVLGNTVYLHGDLGAGKTTFVRGALRGLGYKGKVKSPTYTLVETYEFDGFIVNHFDLYRFNSEEEWDAAGFREYFNSRSICFVEWPEKAANLLPQADFHIKMGISNLGRKIEIIAD